MGACSFAGPEEVTEKLLLIPQMQGERPPTQRKTTNPNDGQIKASFIPVHGSSPMTVPPQGGVQKINTKPIFHTLFIGQDHRVRTGGIASRRGSRETRRREAAKEISSEHQVQSNLRLHSGVWPN